MNTQIPTLQLNSSKIRGVADVVFVVDTSPSMDPVIEQVKNHIDTFVSSINRSSQIPIDLRLGLVVHYANGGERVGVYHWNFTSDVSEFRSRLAKCNKLSADADEYGLPALDMALDFPWRSSSRRFVISFTDEPVVGGHEPDFQLAKLDQLARKFVELGVHGYLIGPECAAFDELARAPKMVRVRVEHDGLIHYDFSEFLSGLGKTVSMTSEHQSPADMQLNYNLYNL